MSRKAAVVALVLALAVSAASLLGGCSGAGESTAKVSGASTQTLAAGEVTTALLLERWLQMLYADEGLTLVWPSTSGVTRPASTHRKPSPSSVRPAAAGYQVYDDWTDGNGVHFVCYEYYDADGNDTGIGKETITWPPPDSRTRNLSWSATYEKNGYPANDFTEDWSDGTHLTYTWVDLFDKANPISHQSWAGTATLTGGLTVQFSVDRTDNRDVLQVSSSDGSALNITIPLTAIFGAPFWPQFTQPMLGTGTFAGVQQSFTLTGTSDGRWTGLAFTAGANTAQFTLGSDLIGSGQLAQGSTTLGALSWDWSKSLDGSLTQVTGQASAVVPAESAQRFQMDQWVYSIAYMGADPEW